MLYGQVPGLDARFSSVEAIHEPFIRKRQRAAALQDASEGHVLPAFRQVLDCASPLALWLSPQKWVHGTDARPIVEVETLHEPQRAAGILPAEKARPCRRDVGSTLPGGTSFRRFMVPIRAQNEWRLPMNLKMVLLISNGLRN